MLRRLHAALPIGTNLEELGQNNRLRLGVGMLGFALLGTVLVVQSSLHWAWRLPLFLPFFFAAFGAWQGLFRICPGMAFKGVRETPSGIEGPVQCESDLCAARQAARTVVLGALVTAVVSTAIVVFLP